MRRIVGLSFFCVLLVVSAGAKESAESREASAMAAAESHYRGKHYEESLPLWKKLAKEKSLNAEIAQYRLLELPFRMESNLSATQKKRYVGKVQTSIAATKNEFLRLAYYVLIAEFDPKEPALQGLFSPWIRNGDLRLAFAAQYGEAMHLMQTHQPGLALQGFQRAKQIFQTLIQPDSSSELQKGNNANPYLPWSAANLSAQISRLEQQLRELDDRKIHAEALGKYQSKQFDAAKTLFQKIPAAFPKSPFLLSSEFHIAACTFQLYQPLKKKKYVRANQEKPLLDFLSKHPISEDKSSSGIARFHVEAWTLIGDSRCMLPSDPDRDVQDTWAKALSAAENCPDFSPEALNLLRLKQAALFYENGEREQAMQLFQAMQNANQSELHGMLFRELKHCFERGDTLILNGKRVFAKTRPADRRALILLACNNNLYYPAGAKPYADYLLRPEIMASQTKEFLSAAANILATYAPIPPKNDPSFHPDADHIKRLEKAIREYPNTVYHHENYRRLCLLYAQCGMSDESDQLGLAFLRKFPKKSEVHHWILLQVAFSAYAGEKMEEALTLYRNYLELYPDRKRQSEKIRMRVLEIEDSMEKRKAKEEQGRVK